MSSIFGFTFDPIIDGSQSSGHNKNTELAIQELEETECEDNDYSMAFAIHLFTNRDLMLLRNKFQVK